MRQTWWGGLLLAMAEAGIVGGLADWFAVTAIFRRPLGLPIPHTALIPTNWELMAERVGTMVGDRVLTKEYVSREIGRVDLGELVARGAERIGRDDLDALTRTLGRWAAEQLDPPAIGELTARLERLLAARPAAPFIAAAVERARQYGWDEKLLAVGASALADALDRPVFRQAIGELVDDLMTRYAERMGTYSRFWMGLATVLGVLDRARIVAALRAGVEDVARDPDHPLRRRLATSIAELPVRLRTDAALVERVEALKRELFESPFASRLVTEAAEAVRRAVLAEVDDPRSELVTWIGDRLEGVRLALTTDAELRRALDQWIKTRAMEALDRYHGRFATFIERGVHALGAEGAVRLIEEHAGDDLQYIRVNGTVVGGLAGGAIYLVHLALRLL